MPLIRSPLKLWYALTQRKITPRSVRTECARSRNEPDPYRGECSRAVIWKDATGRVIRSLWNTLQARVKREFCGVKSIPEMGLLLSRDAPSNDWVFPQDFFYLSFRSSIYSLYCVRNWEGKCVRSARETWRKTSGFFPFRFSLSELLAYKTRA